MKPLGSLNLQGFFVFRIVQFSRYQFVIFIDPLHSAAFLLYHIAYRLSSTFSKFLFSLVGLSRFSGSLGDLFILPHLPPFVNTKCYTMCVNSLLE